MTGKLLAPLIAVLAVSANAQKQAEPQKVLHQQPLYFEQNVGQADSRVKFLARGGNHTVLISDAGTSIAVRGRDAVDTIHMTLRGSAGPGTTLHGLDALPGRINYLIGNDPAKWHTNVPTYARVERRDIYPGVDVVYYGSARQLEYDLVVKPNASVDAIRLAFDGASMRLNQNGDLILQAAAGEVRQLKPVIYQVEDGIRKPVAGGYALTGAGDVSFDVPSYDHSRPLIIDPTLTFASFLGGSADDFANAVAVDASGNMYVTGNTNSTQFPGVNLGRSAINAGENDVFVTKLTPGSALVYSTYVGGSGNDRGNGIAVDSAGNAYVTGSTGSVNFPVVSAAQPIANVNVSDYNTDAFVFAVNASGGGLIYSTYLGGSGNDIGNAIALDASQNAYVTGSTQSSDFPVVNAFQSKRGSTYSNGTTAFVAKYGPTGLNPYTTYLGGSGYDVGVAIAADSSGVYVAGNTNSTDFPLVNSLQSAGSYYYYNFGFVSKFNLAGTALTFSTLLGNDYQTNIKSMAVDPAGNIYITGPGTPSPAAATESFSTSSGCCPSYAYYVGKILANGSAMAYWFRINGGANSIAVDSGGHVYLTGTADSSLFTTSPFQLFGGGYSDAFVAKFNATGTSQVYASLLGGNGSEVGNAIAIDGLGSAYIAGTVGLVTNQTFPATAPTQAAAGGGSYDAFVAKVTDSTPFIDSVSPSSVIAGGADFVLTVNGSGFTNSTSVLWSGSPRTTTFVSSTQLTLAVPAADIATGGTVAVSLAGAAAGSSLFQTFLILAGNPVPKLSSISPTSATLAGSSFQLSLAGSGFLASSVVRWNGLDRTTTFINSGQLTAQITASDLSVTGPIPITVFNPTPGGGLSAAFSFTVNINHSITTLQPSSAFAGGPGFTMTVNGKNFVNGAVVRWNGSDRMTTFVSSTQLTAQITAADILAPVQAQLTVFLPGAAGGLSAALSFPIAGNYPLPVIASVSPATLFACSSTDVIITGNGFVGPPPGSSYYYGPTTTLNIGTSQYSYYSVTVIDSTKIKLPSLSLSPGTYSISVSNPTPGGGLSNSVVLTVNNPSPVIFSISPKVATAGGAAFTLNLVPSGCSAPSGAVVRWSGMDRTTTASNIYSYNYPYGYIYTLSASIPASDLVNAGTAQVTLSYPPPGGGESPPMTFFINPVTAPAPGISTIFPAVAAAGASGLTVTVNGSGFTSSSVVMWNGNARTTTQVSATQLKAAITAADLVAPATAQVSVFTPTPGGGTSTSLPFSIVASLTPAGSVLAGFVAALPGGQVRVPLSLNLNPGTTVDNVAFGVTITPSGSGANLTGSLAFEKDAAMPAPSQLDTTAAPNALSLFWNNLASPLSGTVQLGNVVVNIPALGASGHTYLLQITGADASLGSSHIFLNVSSSSISVSADYGVSDVFPVTNDSAGNFGDSAVNTVDLIATLRAVTNIPGFAPLACSDRFDALDSYPVDTPTKVGGDGFLNTLDLIQTLKRVTNLDTSRPRRLPRNIPCSSAEPMLHRPSARPDLRVEVGEPESPNRFPLYLVATRKLEIGGLSFSVLGEHLRFQPAAGSEPDLSDDQIPGTLALAWLKAVPLDAGQRVLLGYFENDAMPQVEGVSAHNAAGETIAIGWKSTRPAVR